MANQLSCRTAQFFISLGRTRLFFQLLFHPFDAHFARGFNPHAQHPTGILQEDLTAPSNDDRIADLHGGLDRLFGQAEYGGILHIGAFGGGWRLKGSRSR